jgi:PEGA domain
MKERGNKTIMCSVLFLDIVEYSKKSVSGQIALKTAFNAILSEAIRAVPLNDRIILDTGDGAALSFLGDVEDALKVALILREKWLSEGAQIDPPLLVRMGINLGPVRLVRDINDQPNIVGDGINVAQRVMGFSEPGQVLVSRSYHDAVSHVSSEHASLFKYQGSRTDKHVRDHEVYEITQANTAFLATAVSADTKKSTAPNSALRYGGVALGLILAVVMGVIFWPKNEPQPAPILPPQAAPLLASQPVVTPPPLVPEKPLIEPKVESVFIAAKPPSSKPEGAKLNDSKAEKTKKMARTRSVEETTPMLASPPALLSLAVAPWGEVYLDGRMQGVSPPLAELQVLAGKHEIEIRNSTFPHYLQSITVGAGETIKIKHKFSQ